MCLTLFILIKHPPHYHTVITERSCTPGCTVTSLALRRFRPTCGGYHNTRFLCGWFSGNEGWSHKALSWLSTICARGGFRPTKDKQQSKRALCDPWRGWGNRRGAIDLLPVGRVLGMQWCIQSDALKFKITIQDRPLTCRGILSMVSSVYDPLGVLALVVFKASNSWWGRPPHSIVWSGSHLNSSPISMPS